MLDQKLLLSIYGALYKLMGQAGHVAEKEEAWDVVAPL